MRPRRAAAAARVLATVLLALPFCCAGFRPAGAEERAPAVHSEPQWDRETVELARLFDAVVETIEKKFFDETLLKRLDWRARANAVRPSVLSAASTEDAAHRINALLSELKTSHTALYTPDEYQYYILLDVLRGDWETSDLVSRRFWGSGPYYPGIGAFTLQVEDRHFVDGILEGSPAERAGLKSGTRFSPSMECPTVRSRLSAARSAQRSSLHFAAALTRSPGACKSPSARHGPAWRLQRRPRPARASSSVRAGGSATFTSGGRMRQPPSRTRWPGSSRRALFRSDCV